MNRSRYIVPLLVLAGCAGNETLDRPGGGTTGGTGGTGGSGGNPLPEGGIVVPPPGGGVIVPGCTTACQDFPRDPIIGPGAPPNAPTLFGNPDNFTNSGVCVMEPHLSSGNLPGALIPPNWLRPRFRFATTSGNLFEIRVTSSVEEHALVAYTTEFSWTMPEAIWKAAAPNHPGKSMTITVRAVNANAPSTPIGYRGDVNIAPVKAGGTMVFWTVTSSAVGPDSSKLMGFAVGDEGVIEALAPKTVKFTGIIHENGRDLRGEYGGGKPGFSPGEVQCVGCHVSTPGGEGVVFTDDWPWEHGIASVKTGESGAVPAYVTPGARALLKMPWLGMQAMTKGHWAPGDRILLSGYGTRTKPFDPANGQRDRFAWIDLETTANISDVVPPENGMRDTAAMARNQAIETARGTGWNVLAMDGETGNAVTPNWSRSGERIAYVSTDKSPDGHPDYTATRADIYTVPYNDRKGGAVSALPGASSPDFLEYYPAYSGDDKFIAFTRAKPKGACAGCLDGPYYNRFGEIHVIPSAGGTSVRVAANDPVSCAGDDLAKGLINSWPKWSPNVVSHEGKSYYFLIFSSARNAPNNFDIPRGMYTPVTLDTRSSQLYMAAVVVDEQTGMMTTFPGVYLWNQNRLVAPNGMLTDVRTSNLTPAWDEFQIPPVPPIIVK
jgi:hypothetical protein